jgi:hypothetical protein
MPINILRRAFVAADVLAATFSAAIPREAAERIRTARIAGIIIADTCQRRQSWQ